MYVCVYIYIHTHTQSPYQWQYTESYYLGAISSFDTGQEEEEEEYSEAPDTTVQTLNAMYVLTSHRYVELTF